MPKPTSHYIPYFTVDGSKGTQEAACTEYVDPSCHSTEPSCSGCAAWLAEDPVAVQRLRDADQDRQKVFSRAKGDLAEGTL